MLCVLQGHSALISDGQYLSTYMLRCASTQSMDVLHTWCTAVCGKGGHSCCTALGALLAIDKPNVANDSNEVAVLYVTSRGACRRVARILDSFHLLLSEQQGLGTPGLPKSGMESQRGSGETTHATREVDDSTAAESPPEGSDDSLGQTTDGIPDSLSTSANVQGPASLSLSTGVLANAGIRMAFESLPGAQAAVDHPGVWVLLAAVVKYINRTLQPKACPKRWSMSRAVHTEAYQGLLCSSADRPLAVC